MRSVIEASLLFFVNSPCPNVQDSLLLHAFLKAFFVKIFKTLIVRGLGSSAVNRPHNKLSWISQPRLSPLNLIRHLQGETYAHCAQIVAHTLAVGCTTVRSPTVSKQCSDSKMLHGYNSPKAVDAMDDS